MEIKISKINSYSLKKIVFICIAINLFIIGSIFAYFQLWGSKIVVEPPKKQIVTPIFDIDQGVVIDDSMLMYTEVDARNYSLGSALSKEDIVKCKTLIKLKANAPIFKFMLQTPEEQHKPGYFTVSIDLKGVSGTVANQIHKNDYINLMISKEKNSSSKKQKEIIIGQCVLAKKQILDLVNASGSANTSETSDTKNFKTQYIKIEMNLDEYRRYRYAVLLANSIQGEIEAVLCDPTQEPIKEDFTITAAEKILLDKNTELSKSK